MRYPVIACVALTLLCSAQTKTSGNAETRGTCSPAITGSGNAIDIKTCGLGQRQIADFRELLRSMLDTEKVDTAEVIKKLDACLQTMAPRRLTASEKKAIEDAIAPYPAEHISVICPAADTEAQTYAMDFIQVFKRHQWTGVEKGCSHLRLYGGLGPVGLEIAVSQVDVDAGRIPGAAMALLNTLLSLGLIQNKAMYKDSDLKSGEFTFTVGVKPPTSAAER